MSKFIRVGCMETENTLSINIDHIVLIRALRAGECEEGKYGTLIQTTDGNMYQVSNLFDDISKMID